MEPEKSNAPDLSEASTGCGPGICSWAATPSYIRPGGKATGVANGRSGCMITDGILTELWIVALAAIVNRIIPSIHADVVGAIRLRSERRPILLS